MHLASLSNCCLRISNYPYFNYNGSGGGGIAEVKTEQNKDIKYLKFDKNTFNIPPLTWKTTKFLGFPMLPGLKISMLLHKLEGTFDEKSGKLLLEFESKFILSILNVLKFPELDVKTCLTTDKKKTLLNDVEGKCVGVRGEVTLVGIAIIPPSGNKLLDYFLQLPNEALAILKCKITV